MTTCADVITMAATRARIIRPGATLKASEADDGLLALQGMFEEWAHGMFGRLTDKLVTENTEAEVGQRIRVDGAYTITMPDVDADDDEKPVKDLSVVEILYTDPSVSREVHVYEAGIAGWVQINALALTDEAPLATRGPTGLADALAMFWTDGFGGEVPPSVKRGALAFMRSLSWKFDSEETVAVYY